MYYYVLTKQGIVILWSTAQQVTDIENTTSDIKDAFKKIDAVIHTNFKFEERVYSGDKPNPEDCA